MTESRDAFIASLLLCCIMRSFVIEFSKLRYYNKNKTLIYI